MRLAALAFILSTVANSTDAHAQVGSTTDIILGRVTGPDSLPLENARVEVTSAESGITRNRLTNAKGQYSIVFPDGGGAYQLRVTYLGMAPFQTTIQRQADEDRLVANVQMSRAQAHELAPVVVRGQPRPQGPPRPEAGNTERLLPSGMTTRLPVDAGNLNDLATLAPGVIGIAGTDSTGAGFSIAGQPSNQNNITLDGLSFGASEIPQEALRNTRVITSTYDVGRGQFTGGMIASTTRGGTNMKQGVFNYSFRDPSLEFVDEDASFGKYRQNQLSGGFGLPIVKDKAFAFGAFTVSRRTTDLMSLLSADSVTLQRLGTNPALVERFLDAMTGYGIPATLPGTHATPSSITPPHSSAPTTGSTTLTRSWGAATSAGRRRRPRASPRSPCLTTAGKGTTPAAAGCSRSPRSSAPSLTSCAHTSRSTGATRIPSVWSERRDTSPLWTRSGPLSMAATGRFPDEAESWQRLRVLLRNDA